MYDSVAWIRTKSFTWKTACYETAWSITSCDFCPKTYLYISIFVCTLTSAYCFTHLNFKRYRERKTRKKNLENNNISFYNYPGSYPEGRFVLVQVPFVSTEGISLQYFLECLSRSLVLLVAEECCIREVLVSSFFSCQQFEYCTFLTDENVTILVTKNLHRLWLYHGEFLMVT